MNNHYPDYEIVAPAAGAMIESLRAYGYSPATAIADIIDNSISAGARNVWLQFYWSGKESHITILDDGCGMDEATLVTAMRPGSHNPLEARSPMDLGRFGMGLKTASFSQCKRLVVRSKTLGYDPCLRAWDINHVMDTNEWRLLKKAPLSTEAKLTGLDKLESGTMVLWEDLDKLMGAGDHKDEYAHNRFNQIIEEVSAYLEMVFHNFLAGLNPKLRIELNNNRLKPWDPFCAEHPCTVEFPSDPLVHAHGTTSITGFVLPHKDKLKPEEYDRQAGPGGWNARQGFYIYRNNRLLVPGGWLGLGRNRAWMQEEQYKLARIRIDIPNTLDFDWLIDVKKSTAHPPAWIRGRLTDLAEMVRNKARQVFVHRGKYPPRGVPVEVTRIWKAPEPGRIISYKIDRSHYLVKTMNELTKADNAKEIFSVLLRTIEETVPIARIWLDTAENSENHGRPFATVDDIEIRRMLELSIKLLRDNGMKFDAAVEKMKQEEAYLDHHDMIDELSREVYSVLQ